MRPVRIVGTRPRSVIDFTCPFCKLPASAGYSEDGRPLVVHKVPMCRRFEALQPHEYMAAVRRCWSN